MRPCLPFQHQEGKVKEIHVTQDVADKDKIGGKIRSSMWNPGNPQLACPIKIMKWLEQDQGKSSVSHIDFALMHEKIKGTDLIFSSILHAQRGRILVSIKIKISPTTVKLQNTKQL